MLIDRDPFTGESVWYEFNRGTHQAVITHEQDVSRIIDNNMDDQNNTWRTQEGIKRDWWHYATSSQHGDRGVEAEARCRFLRQDAPQESV